MHAESVTSDFLGGIINGKRSYEAKEKSFD